MADRVRALLDGEEVVTIIDHRKNPTGKIKIRKATGFVDEVAKRRLKPISEEDENAKFSF